MKNSVKFLAIAVLSLAMGIASASPLLITELKIRPWIHEVQGQTAQFSVNVIYANFTIQDADKPVEQDSGPTITYFAVVNITNFSDLNATLTRVNFLAAQNIANDSGPAIENGAVGWEAEGAWVDGKWYNLTWVNVTYPYFDENGIFHQPEFKLPEQPYWMEGVQVYDRYVNGTLVATYLNMNGTWTDVANKINVARMPLDSGYSIVGTVVDDTQCFENVAVRDYTSNGIAYGPSIGAIRTTYHLVGEGFFSNYWAPHQSRLVAVFGSWDVHEPFASDETVKALQSGNLTFKTQTTNFVEEGSSMINNTVTTTSSDAVELKRVQLTQNENSYIYSPLVLDNQAFLIDQWGVEVNLRSQTQ